MSAQDLCPKCGGQMVKEGFAGGTTRQGKRFLGGRYTVCKECGYCIVYKQDLVSARGRDGNA